MSKEALLKQTSEIKLNKGAKLLSKKDCKVNARTQKFRNFF